MSSLSQYLNLYDSQREMVERGSTAVMNRWRPDARAALEGATLPNERTEGYEKTSIEKMMAPDLGVNLTRLNFNAAVASTFRCDIPNMTTLLAVVVNDIFHPSATLRANLPEGVVFDTISAFARSHPEVAERYYGSVAPLDNPCVALNTLLAQDGVVLYVPDGVRLAKPLQLVNIFASDSPLVAFRRLLVIIGDGAEARLLTCDHTQSADTQFIAQQVVEVSLGRRASLELYDMEKSTPHTSRHSLTFVSQAEGSRFLSHETTLTCGVTRNDIVVDLGGEHCECRLAGMAIATGEMHIDNDTYVTHLAPRCNSNQLYKYVLEDNARGAFEGTIHVGHEAPFTNAYQTNRNLIANPGAKMHTKPQLLIYNDEVKCSHGATTGQLDSEALFYMQTRGIPLAEARTMLMQAFMVDVIDSVSLEALRDRLRHMVERRFQGDGALCEICNNCEK